MKLLLDENLPDRLVQLLGRDFPDSIHVKGLGLLSVDDGVIWEFARRNAFVIVSKDADFRQRSLAWGHPPKVIYLRIGNCTTHALVTLLSEAKHVIVRFGDDETESMLILS